MVLSKFEVLLLVVSVILLAINVGLKMQTNCLLY